MAVVVILIVEDDAQLVQYFYPTALVGTAVNPGRVAILRVPFIGDVIGVHPFQLCFQVKPGAGELVVDVGQLAEGGGDGLAQLGNALPGNAGGGDDMQQVGVFVLQFPFIQFKRVFVLFVDDDDDGGVVAEAAHQFEPMAQAAFLLSGAGVDDDKIQAATGKCLSKSLQVK